MTIEARVVADSINSKNNRLVTIAATYWRGIHAELMTHREFSRNASSSRAIPVAKMFADVRDNPFVPLHWGKNEPGMQARAELDDTIADLEGPGDEFDAGKATARGYAKITWLRARNDALKHVQQLNGLGLHKQIANRLSEPFGHITVLISSTEWPNFFGQRCSDKAEPHMERLGEVSLKALNESEPTFLESNEWHRPFITKKDIEWVEIARQCAFADGMDELNHPELNAWWLLNKISVARCARVSYKNHDQTDPDPAKDIELYEKLLSSHHMSPFEHVARADGGSFGAEGDANTGSGNFRGWTQWRKFIRDERIEKFDRFIVKTTEQARLRRYPPAPPTFPALSCRHFELGYPCNADCK